MGSADLVVHLDGEVGVGVSIGTPASTVTVAVPPLPDIEDFGGVDTLYLVVRLDDGAVIGNGDFPELNPDAVSLHWQVE